MPVFKRFAADDIVRANPSEITTGLWPGDTGSLALFFTGSQTADLSGQYYFNVYNINPSSSNAQVAFAVAYGHRTGGGHPTLIQDDNSTLATQAVYSSYRNMLLDPSDSQFTFEGDVNKDHIYVINIQRSLIREKLDPGNWQLALQGPSGSITLIDDSGQSLGSGFGKTGQVFSVVSGSLSGSAGATIFSTTSSVDGGFGLFYPSLGVIVLNPDAIANTLGFAAHLIETTSGVNPFKAITGSAATPQYNHSGLLKSMRLAADFQARSAEVISSTHYFVRARAREFNYSNNPTFYDETNGSLINPTFINDPHTYITTVGMYNDSNECVAVAKPSSPLPKNYSTEVNIKVRLDF